MSTSATTPTGLTSTGVGPTSAFPEMDTPLGNLPSNLKSQWQGQGVTIVPSRHIFDNLPALPAVNNATGGVTSTDKATAAEQAFWRAGAITTWAAAHVQNALVLFNGAGDPISDSVNTGSAVTDPACDVYPVSFKVVTITTAAVAWIHHLFQNGGGSIGVVAKYQGTPACTVTTTKNGQTSTLPKLSFTSHTLYLTGDVMQDPVLGSIWVRDSVADCAAAGAPADCS